MDFADIMRANFSTLQILELCLRMVLACIIGAGIGLERISHSKGVGPFTHAITCFAAALIMITSKYGFADLGDSVGGFLLGTKGADPSRIASQAITGISFLCAGLIFKTGTSVRGLTTAAGMWLTLTLGLSLGAGMYFMTLCGVVLLLILHFIFRRLRIGYGIHANQLSFTVKGDRDAFNAALEKQLKIWDVKTVTDRKTVWNADDTATFKLTIHTKTMVGYEEVTAFMKECDCITSASSEPLPN